MLNYLKERNLKDNEGERTVEISEDVLINYSQLTILKEKWECLFMLFGTNKLEL